MWLDISIPIITGSIILSSPSQLSFLADYLLSRRTNLLKCCLSICLHMCQGGQKFLLSITCHQFPQLSQINFKYAICLREENILFFSRNIISVRCFLASCIARFWNHLVCVCVCPSIHPSIHPSVRGQECEIFSSAFVVWHCKSALKYFIENFLLADFYKMHRAFGV